MAERAGEKCRFSGHAFALETGITVPVECPECGAVRKLLPREDRAENRSPLRDCSMDEFPLHASLIRAHKTSKKRWKRVSNQWQIIEA